MEEDHSSDWDRSEGSADSDARSSSVSLEYSSSSFEDGESEAGIVEPYLYEPEDTEEAEAEGSVTSDGEGDHSRRERLDNTDWYDIKHGAKYTASTEL